MNSALMMERGTTTMPGMSTGSMTGTSGMPASMNMMMVPRCTIRMEKCEGGMTMKCTSDDKMAVAMMQNLCTMLAGSMCSCCMMMNGMMACCCNLTMAICKCETMDDGVCITCTSGDKACGEMIQACCDCCSSMMKAGCTCCIMMGNMPICCGC